MRYVSIFALAAMVGGCAPAPPPLAHGKPIGHWVQALQDPDARARRRAADVLGNVGAVDPGVVRALIGAAQDPNAEVRGRAVVALLKIGPTAQEAVPVLAEVQKKDRDPKVRADAVRALARIQSGG